MRAALDAKARIRQSIRGMTGGANRDRTGDLLLAKQALSQLSYGPLKLRRGVAGAQLYVLPVKPSRLVGLGGLEPPTPRLSSVCSNQLSYRPGIRQASLNAQPIGVDARRSVG